MQTKPYGTWESPLTVDEIYKPSAGLTARSELYVDSTSHEIYHIENRPHENGRSVLCRSLPPVRDLVPRERDVRTRVHEYGGGAAAVSNGWAYYSDFTTGHVYRTRPDDAGHDSSQQQHQQHQQQELVTPESKVYRYADFNVHPTHPDLVVAVREDHTIDEPSQVVNTLVLIDASQKSVSVLREGKDFYASPKWDSEGVRLAWIEWDHPYMPWEGTELYFATFDVRNQRSLETPKRVAGESGKIAVTQPNWFRQKGTASSIEKLFYMSDETGFTNLWSTDVDGSSNTKPSLAMKPSPTDFGTPMWSLGTSDYAVLSQHSALVVPIVESQSRLSHLDLQTGHVTPIVGGEIYRQVDQVTALSGTQAVFIGSKYDAAPTLVIVTLTSDLGSADFKEIATSPPSLQAKPPLDSSWISRGETLKLSVPWPQDAQRPPGMPSSQTEVDLHVVYYPPTNPDFKAPEGTSPPCIVAVHGGPTSMAYPTYDVFHQFFTTRGFAAVYVNYGGSTGYGRQYRERLFSNWGLVDVSDSIQAVAKLAELGKVDASRAAIRGGSAGGFTALACLTDSRAFAAGVSLYGVTDLNLLTKDTHKFESQYMFKLVGGRQDEIPQVYHDRSPINKAGQIKDAVLILQGNDDKVVPPSQAHEMIKKIKQAGVPVESVFYDGEGHGFRKLENQKDSLNRTEAFLKKVLRLGDE